MPNIDIIFAFLTAFLVTALVTPISIHFMKKFGIMDDPKLHIHPALIHTKPIPRGGGIPLFIGVFIAGLLFIPFTPMIAAIYSASFLALTIGVIDDKMNAKSKDLSPYFRLLIGILCAIIVVGSGVGITFTTNPFTGGIFYFDTFQLFGVVFPIANIISIFWIIWVMTMLNWSKGVDGQMPGIVIISCIVIGLLSLRLSPNDMSAIIDAKLSFIIAGAMLGFLLYNFYPSKILPGYGTTAIYLLVAVVSMLSSAKLATALLVMGIPTVDAGFTILRRLINHKSPFFGDNRHLHHLLLKIGYSQRQVAIFYWCISAVLGIISLTLDSKSKLFALIMLVVIVGMILLFLQYVTKELHEEITS